jgi:putative tryptophan/tyrosine transport system substrate-binding protein
MQRRVFLGVLGGAAAWPIAARAQQPARVRRIGVLMNLGAEDPEGQVRVAAFLQGLQQIGWSVGRNLQIDYRWGASDPDRIRTYATELVALAQDVIVASGGTVARALQLASHTIPIVFVQVADPVGIGVVASLARPGGNATGFTQFEFVMSEKWFELLKEIAPYVKRVAVLRNPTNAGAIGQLGALQSAARSSGVEVSLIDERDVGEIERAVTAFARGSNGGLIMLTGTGGLTPKHRDLIITLAAQYRLPAIYPYRYFTTSGGLISYGPDTIDPYRRAAAYVDRILKGEKPADLPVQAPTKYETVINLKTAKALGLTVPPALLSRADEVIE